MHRILQRQIKKYLGEEHSIPVKLKKLFSAVSKTYDDLEDDHTLIEHSLELSSKELGENIALLQATLESAGNGILVTDLNGKMTNFNQEFQKIWKLPEEILSARDSWKAFKSVLDNVNDRETFEAAVAPLLQNKTGEGTGAVTLKSGQVIQWSTRPLVLGKKSVGNVWSFADITEQKEAEQDIKDKVLELETLNDMMLGRELKMAELKDEIKSLRETPVKKG